MSAAEVFSALGTPARTAARILLAPRYIFNGFAQLRAWNQNAYAQARYGPSYIWRLWLLFDCRELEVLENILNQGSDEDVLRMREAKLEQFKLVALVVCTPPPPQQEKNVHDDRINVVSDKMLIQDFRAPFSQL